MQAPRSGLSGLGGRNPDTRLGKFGGPGVYPCLSPYIGGRGLGGEVLQAEVPVVRGLVIGQVVPGGLLVASFGWMNASFHDGRSIDTRMSPTPRPRRWPIARTMSGTFSVM